MFSEQIEQNPLVEAVDDSRKWRMPQFSIRGLLILTTIFAVLFAMIASPFLAAIVMVVVTLFIAGATTIAIIFSRGWLQAFAIGFAPALILGLVFAANANRPDEFAILWCVAIFVGSVSGLGGAMMRSYLAKRNGVADVPNIPFLRDWLSN